MRLARHGVDQLVAHANPCGAGGASGEESVVEPFATTQPIAGAVECTGYQDKVSSSLLPVA